MAVTPETIAAELGRTAPLANDPTHSQWDRWIDRARRAIERRAETLGVDPDALDQDTIDDVVTYAVVRRIARPVDGAESSTDQVGVDDGSWQHTRRYPTGFGDVQILDEWWDQLGLALPVLQEWSGSIAYGGRR